ncbi:hypothetical protein ACWGJ9_09170 [Curtobacterium citreum]
MTKVPVTAVIDLNSISADGTTRSRTENVSGPVAPGDVVTVRELEDDITGVGVVVRVDAGYAHIAIDRNSLR